MRLYFIAAVYNEEDEIEDLLLHLYPWITNFCIADDGSTDRTVETLRSWYVDDQVNFDYKSLPHTGLPETVKNEALKMVPDGSWVLMLDADERLTDDTRDKLKEFFESGTSDAYDYVYFNQQEIIDGQVVRQFQKSKLFRKEAIVFPLDDIHADDKFIGRGVYFDDWVVLHRKTTSKQIAREIEYLETYQKLLDEGKIDQGRYEWLKGLHHFVR